MSKITVLYHTWLSKYILEKNCPHKKIALALMQQIKDVDSIEEFQKILLACPIQPDTQSIVGQGTGEPFIQRLSILRKHVSDIINSDIEAIHSRLYKLCAKKPLTHHFA